MRVRIGIADTDKLLEIEIEDIDRFKKELARAIDDNGVGWFTDTKGRSVGIPGRNVAFVEIDDAGTPQTVGFAPGG